MNVSEFLDYDAETGKFTWLARDRVHFSCSAQWRNWNARYPGTEAGSVGLKGYRAIGLHGRFHKAHRLAWTVVYGVEPESAIDHINGDRDDNRIANLREATRGENLQNQRNPRSDSSSGYLGVSPYPYRDGWTAQIHKDGIKKHLGVWIDICYLFALIDY